MPTLPRRNARLESREVFVDTGAWIAPLSRDDEHHGAAAAAWPEIVRRFRRVVVTNLVVAEGYTFLRRAVGVTAALILLDRLQATPRVALVYADAELEAAAKALLQQYRDHDFSYTDAVSFVTMRQGRISRAFGFDRHFLTVGFTLVPRPRHERWG